MAPRCHGEVLDVEVIKSNLGVQISSLVKKCDTWIVYPDISQSNTSDCPFSPVMMDNFCDYPIIPVTIKHWQWRIPIYTCFSQENTLKPLFGRISQPPPLPLEACRRGKMPSGSTG
jgi:hypothetical protein